jgi:hypothetical protein
MAGFLPVHAGTDSLGLDGPMRLIYRIEINPNIAVEQMEKRIVVCLM